MNIIPPDYRKQLADEFRAAVEAAKLEYVLPESRSCDWCGNDVYRTDDHAIIARQYMCLPCHTQYFPEGMER